MSSLIMIQDLQEVAKIKEQPGEIRAGGTDFSDRHRLHGRHTNIIDISQLPDLDRIEPQPDGSVGIGAHVTVAAIAADRHLISHYPGLAMAAGALATPQIRAMATMGGVLLQRSRCWYFRNPSFSCYKNGGNQCPAREGDHRYGVIFDFGPCVFPHPSTIGMMLLAYEARVTINGTKTISMADLYGDGRDPSHDHRLNQGEVLTHIQLPPPAAAEQAAYFRSISRSRAEWALVEAGARLLINDENIITGAWVVAGGVANIPMRLPEVETVLKGRPANEEVFKEAAAAAVSKVKPLPQTQYKVPLLYGTILTTLERAQAGVWGGEG